MVYGKVCCEGLSNKEAFGSAWATANFGEDHWGQAGFTYERIGGTEKVVHYRFAEVQGEQWHYFDDIENAPVAGSTHEYKSELVPGDGLWNFYDDGTKFATLPPPAEPDSYWVGKTATQVKYSGEIRNLEDDMPGIYPRPLCIFSECGYLKSGESSYSDPGITAQDLWAGVPAGEWGVARVSSNSIYIWDKHPLS